MSSVRHSGRGVRAVVSSSWDVESWRPMRLRLKLQARVHGADNAERMRHVDAQSNRTFAASALFLFLGHSVLRLQSLESLISFSHFVHENVLHMMFVGLSQIYSFRTEK